MLRSRRVPLALLALSLIACGDSPPAAPAGTTLAPEPAPPKAAEIAAAKDPVKVGTQAAHRAQFDALQEARDIAQAHASGSLGDRLAQGELLLVDARAPADTDPIHFFLQDGALTTAPTKMSQLRGATAGDGTPARAIMHGGEDASRPGLFSEIKPGTYTACAVIGPAESAESKAYSASVSAAYTAAHGEQFDGEKMMAVAAKVRAETGYQPQKLDWDALPVRCKQVEVTAAAASRVVVLDPGTSP